MKKFNNYIKFGFLFNSIFLFGNYTDLLHEFISGLCDGLGVVLIFIGIYSEKHDISKVRNYKRKYLSRVLSK